MNLTVELMQKLMPEPTGGAQASWASAHFVPAGQKITLTCLALVPSKDKIEFGKSGSGIKQPPGFWQLLVGFHTPVLNCSKA